MERRLAAILAADVVGYSRLMEADEEGTYARLKVLREQVIDPAVAGHNGRIVKLTGDGALVEFSSVVQAVQCAIEIQRGVAARNAGIAQAEQIVFRIGINLGDVMIETDDDIYGGGVNVAARLEGLADPGDILISGTAYDQVEGRLDCGFAFLGEREVKNIERPVRTYRVLWDGGPPAPAHGVAKGGRRWWAGAALGALVLVAIGIAAWLRPAYETADVAEEGHGQAASLDPYRIAVLPFANISADADNEYFSDGMTEELIAQLSKIGDLSVIARTSTMRYKGADKSIAEIGRELNVGTILEGSVRKAGDQVRVTAQLIDVGSQAHLWAEDYDRGVEAIFAIQTDIAEEVARELEITLLGVERERIKTHGTTDVEAHNLYLKAKYLYEQSGTNIGRVIDLLKQALERDPDYAAAHAALADISLSLGSYADVSAEQVNAQARTHAETALALDDSLPEAHFAMARLKMAADRDWNGAEAEFKRAIELDPNFTEARQLYGQDFLAAVRQDDDEALVQVTEALARDPLSSEAMDAVGWVRYYRGEYDAAIAVQREVQDLFPGEPWSYVCIGQSLVRQGRHDEGIAEIEQAVERSPDSSLILAFLGWAYGMSGRTEEAREVVARLEKQAQQDPVSPMAFAWVYAGMGEKEQAIDWLEKAYDERDGALVYARTPDFSDVLDGNPRYHFLLQEMGLEA
jgi:TolB-like protein/class 3 adenylate cyclase/Flp pilus assembly protein TadD